jgi:autotransporter-associated beta strand protein
MNSGGEGMWVKTGPGTLRQLNSGFTGGWVKEGVFLSDAGTAYTLNGGATIGATNAGAPPALVKLLGTRDPVIGNTGGVINRTGIFDIHGKLQTVSKLVFTGGGMVTNSGGSGAKFRMSDFTYNGTPGLGETAVVAVDSCEGSSARNDYIAMQFTINDDPGLDVEVVIAGSLSNYPGSPGWAIQKLGTGTLYFTGTNTWTGTNAVSAGILKVKMPASLPGYNGNNRWPVSAGATLAVCAGGSDEWTVADIDALRGTTPSHFAASSWLGIDTTAGAFTYPSVLGNGVAALGLRKFGTNQLVLANANTFTGGTVIHGGTLVASNANALGTSGTITILSNATFAVGAGITFSRPVTFNPGSALAGQGTFYAIPAWTCPADFTVAPGLPAGTLTVDRSLALAAGNTLSIAFQPDGTYGKLAVNGTLDISEPTARLVLTGKPPAGKHVLAEGTSRAGQFQDENVDLTGLTGTARITYTATQVVLNVDAKGTLIMLR